MKDSVPVWEVVAGMALGAAVAIVAARETLFANQNFDMLMKGREAAIMHLALRISIKSAAFAMVGLVSLRRCLRRRRSDDLGVCLVLAKVVAAIIAGSSLCLELEKAALSAIPAMWAPIALLGGWRAIQLADLALVSVSIVLLVVFADYIHRKIVEAKSWKRRVGYAALAIVVFGGLASPVPRLVRECIVRDAANQIEELEQERPHEEDYRLDVDEPWDMKG